MESGAKHQGMGVSEWLRAARENIGAVLFLLSIVTAGCGTVCTAVVWAIRWEIRHDTEPVLDAVIWKIDKDGDLPAFMRYKARKDSLSRAIEPRISAAGYPIFMGGR